MAISSSDKLVVVKAFAPSNPLPIDSREIHDSMASAEAYAASSATAYAGQTVKVVENNTVTAYYLVPTEEPGKNFKLQFVGGGSAGGGVQNIGTSSTDGNISITVASGDSTETKNVPVVGALVNPVVDEDAHTLTLTKIGATKEDDSDVVIPLGGAAPDTMISEVVAGDTGLTLKVTKFDADTEQSTTNTISIFGAVTGVDASTAGILDALSTDSTGAVVHSKEALVGSVINASYNTTTKVLTLPVVTGKDEETGAVTTNDITIDMKGVTANAIVGVELTEDTETVSGKLDFTYKDATGTDQTKTIYEGGVRKVAAGSSADKIKITTANRTTGTLTDSEILVGVGNVKNPTYDQDTRKITLPVLKADATTEDLVINLGKDMVVKSGSYNTETKNIELVLTDDSKVLIAAGDLVDIYTGISTDTIVITVSDDNKISGAVKLSTKAGNLIKVDTENGGLYVVEEDFTETKKLIADGDSSTLKDAKDYVDENVTTLNSAIEQALQDAKDYADTASSESKTTWVDFGAAAPSA